MRLDHADNNDAATLKWLCDAHVAETAKVVSDGHADYNAASLGERAHLPQVQTKAEVRAADVVQTCHWTVSLLKRWLLCTHVGAVGPAHLQAYLDEYAFRHNRRRTNGLGAHRPLRHRGRGGSCACDTRKADGTRLTQPLVQPTLGRHLT